VVLQSCFLIVCHSLCYYFLAIFLFVFVSFFDFDIWIYHFIPLQITTYLIYYTFMIFAIKFFSYPFITRFHYKLWLRSAIDYVIVIELKQITHLWSCNCVWSPFILLFSFFRALTPTTVTHHQDNTYCKKMYNYHTNTAYFTIRTFFNWLS